MRQMVLGIESSCDETSIAVVAEGCELLSNQIYSQIEQHAPFHGIVPEIASRAHLEKIGFVLADALHQANVRIEQCAAVAVSTNPGLTGSLMIGANLAKMIHLVHGLPVISVNHLEAHLYAACLEGKMPDYPFLGLLLSGGNSAIFKVTGPGQMERIADTMDDALGEAFDKAASLLGLAYPGGPVIEKEAIRYSKENNKEMVYKESDSLFPRLLKNTPRSELAFSFSGIKTAVRYAAHKARESSDRIAFDFQNTVFELVTRMISRAVQKTGIRSVVASGGVLANNTLRTSLQKCADSNKFKLIFPESKVLCTDNAAMVAALGYYLFRAGQSDAGLGFDVSFQAS